MVADPVKFNRRQMVLAGLSAATAVVGGRLIVNQASGQTPGPVELRPKTGVIRLGVEGAESLPMVGYGGAAPGPLITVRRGDEISAQLINDWSEPTLVHWHGVRVPSDNDGFPFLSRAPVTPSQSLDMRLPARDAGTFWYHATPASQFSQGLSGPLIVTESEPIDVDRDLLLMLQDWRPVGEAAGTLMTVNGQSLPALPVRRGERVRLRLINATAGRVLSIQLPGQPAWVMAIDGQPAEPFMAKDSRVMIAPGNRLDLFVDITADGGQSDIPVLVETANAAPVAAAKLAVEGERSGPRRDGTPSPLPANSLPQKIDLRNALRFSADLSATPQTSADAKKAASPKGSDTLGWRPWPTSADALGNPSFTAQRGRTVSATFTNPGNRAAVIHTHGHSFRLLDNLDDGWKPFWLDTLLVAPQQTARIAFIADTVGRWAITTRPLAEPKDERWAWFQVS